MVTETVDEKVVLTTEQALSMLGDDDSIHTFRAVGNMLLGADWDRAELEIAIRQNRCEIGGEMCKRTNHGLVVNVDGWLFVKCKDGFDYDQFEKSVTEKTIG
jgi:hypothetical protein